LAPGRWQKYDVKKLIRFGTAVRKVTFDDKAETFAVVAEQVSERQGDRIAIFFSTGRLFALSDFLKLKT
jgi:cation diffusion facilitator CzcD-associated flavoprotein CzcO